MGCDPFAAQDGGVPSTVPEGRNQDDKAEVVVDYRSVRQVPLEEWADMVSSSGRLPIPAPPTAAQSRSNSATHTVESNLYSPFARMCVQADANKHKRAHTRTQANMCPCTAGPLGGVGSGHDGGRAMGGVCKACRRRGQSLRWRGQSLQQTCAVGMIEGSAGGSMMAGPGGSVGRACRRRGQRV